MFMDELELDGPVDANPSRQSKYLTGDTSRPGTSGGIGKLTLREVDDDDEDQGVRGPDSGSAMSQRARMLEKQREIQLSKRQSSTGGQQMFRRSNDGPLTNSPQRNTDSQTTPAMRQFSQPKAAANEDNNPSSTEFGRNSRNGPPSAQKAPRGRYSDDDDDRPSRSNNESRSSRSNRRDEDDEFDRDTRRNNRDDRDRRERDRRDERDRDYDRPPRDTRRDDRRDDRDDRYREDDRNYRGSGRGGRDDSRERNDSRNSRTNDDDDRWSNRNNKGSSRGYDDRDDNGGSSRRGRRDEDDDSRDGDRRRAANDRSPNRSQSKPKGWDGTNDRRGGRGSDSDRDVPPKKSSGGRQQAEEETEPAKEVFLPPDYSNMRRFLTSPLPKNNGIVQCYIRRNKNGTNKLYPIYSLYLKEGDVFLMASRKRPKNKTSNYLISMDQNDLNRTGNNYLGKLRSNFVGTEFQIFDNGVNPKDADDDNVGRSDASVRCELGSVMYAANVMGSRGPRKMQVALPGLNDAGQITQWKDGSGASGEAGGDLLSRIKDRNYRDMVYLINKPPRWNEQVGAYVLNFNGRVTMASVKNFQLVDPEEQNAVVLQFGRVGKDEFTMDFQWPISPYQAFAVTLSSFDSKIACD